MIGKPLARLSSTKVLVVGLEGGDSSISSSSGVGQRDFERGEEKKGRESGSMAMDGSGGRSLPCISLEKEDRRNFGRKRGDRAGEPGPRETESKTPRLRLSRLLDLLLGVTTASVASSTEDTEEDRSRWCMNSPSPLPHESAGVVGTDMFWKLIFGTLWVPLTLGRLPYCASLLNLDSLGKAEEREVGMVRVDGRSGPRLPSLLLLSRRGDCLRHCILIISIIHASKLVYDDENTRRVVLTKLNFEENMQI